MSGTPTPKLHAAIAQAGLMSRRKAEELIQHGQVTVNGQPAQIGQRINPQTDQVKIEGRPVTLSQPTHYLILVNKPVGVVSTTQDELGRTTVIEYLHQHVRASDPALWQQLQRLRLYPVGRLDRESDGLMLLTNDGNLTQRLTHPSFQSQKTYRVVVEGEPSYKALSHLERGVRLKEGYTAPAEVEVISRAADRSQLEITIHEGRHQQVRRMCERVGYPVLSLTRIKMDAYSLDQLAGKPYQLISPTTV